MGDSDDTPRDRPAARRARSVMGDTDRVEVGRQHREREAARMHDQLDELAEAIGSDGVPGDEADAEGDDTKPIWLHPTPEQQFQFLNSRVSRLKALVKRSRSDTANRITAAMGARPPNARLGSLETRVKIIWAILAVVGTAAAGAVVTVGKGLYARGETDGAHEIRLQNVERAVDTIERELGMPGRLFQPFTAPKGPTAP